MRRYSPGWFCTSLIPLLRDPQWRLLAGSHCSNLCGADTGLWPQKDTYYLCNRLPRKFHLDLCDHDCKHLIEHTERHKVVLREQNKPENLIAKS